MKEIADLKEYLANKIEELKNLIVDKQKELDLLTNVMKKVDTLLIQNSFTPAKELYNQMKEAKVESVKITPSPLKEEEITENNEEPIKFEDTVLATVKSTEKGIIFTLTNSLKMTGDEPPFNSFIMNKIFNELKEGENKEIGEKERINIGVQRNYKEIVEKIFVVNYRTQKRKEKIIKAISWSLRTIYQGK